MDSTALKSYVRASRSCLALTLILGLLSGCTTPTSPRPTSYPPAPTMDDCLRQYGTACYRPTQLRRAYDLDSLYGEGLSGSRQTIAFIEFYGSPTIRQDLGQFDKAFHIPPPPDLNIISPVGPIPSFDSSPTRNIWAGETSLDVEWAHAFAPKASLLVVQVPYGPQEAVLAGATHAVAAVKYVVDNRLAQIICQAGAFAEERFPPGSIVSLERTYEDARAHNVTILTAAGDTGPTAYRSAGRDVYLHRAVNWPADSPLVTTLGGTQLSLNRAGARTQADVVWNQDSAAGGNSLGPPEAAAGGRSSAFPRPSYQDGVRHVAGSRRSIPDISMSSAYDGALIVFHGFLGARSGWFTSGGTSGAVPLLAGVIAIADQAAGHPLGLLNPVIYRLALSDSPGIVDITRGSNNVMFAQGGRTHSVNGWNAVPGYDLASGLGTVDARHLVDELAPKSSAA